MNDTRQLAERVRGGVLIGGLSRRMGQPKATLRHGDTSFVERVVSALAESLEDVVLIGRGDLSEALRGAARLDDEPDFAGPLAGMLAALSADLDSAWVFAACDLPLIRPQAVDWLLTQRRAGLWAVLPSLRAGTVEPLFAIYEPQARSPLMEIAHSSRPSPSLLAGHPRVSSPIPPEDISECWTNVNTPSDHDRLG